MAARFQPLEVRLLRDSKGGLCSRKKNYFFLVGTYKLKDEKVLQEVLDVGLKCGYRLIGPLLLF